jgi:hypothetical protein
MRGLSCWFVEPEVGFEPTTFRLRARCSASTWTDPDGSSLLTLDASSVQTAPDGSGKNRLDDHWDDQDASDAASDADASRQMRRPSPLPLWAGDLNDPAWHNPMVGSAAGSLPC